MASQAVGTALAKPLSLESFFFLAEVGSAGAPAPRAAPGSPTPFAGLGRTPAGGRPKKPG